MLVVKTQTIEVPDLAQKIALAIEADNRSPEQICAAIDISKTTLYKIINGKPQLDLKLLRALEQTLGVNFGVNL